MLTVLEPREVDWFVTRCDPTQHLNGTAFNEIRWKRKSCYFWWIWKNVIYCKLTVASAFSRKISKIISREQEIGLNYPICVPKLVQIYLVVFGCKRYKRLRLILLLTRSQKMQF